MGKGLNPGSSNLPDPSAAADKAAGNAKGLASDAKQGAKNVASDLSENPLSGLGDKVRAGWIQQSSAPQRLAWMLVQQIGLPRLAVVKARKGVLGKVCKA